MTKDASRRDARGAMAVTDPARMYRAIFEWATQPLVVLAEDGSFLHINAAARDVGVNAEAYRLFTARRTTSADFCLTDGQGVRRAFVVDQRSVEGGSLLTFRDVTELRAAADALAQSRRIESLGYVTAGAVHDFNNLLTPILCASALLALDASEADSKTTALAAEIRSAAERAAELVRQLMRFARREPSLVRRVDVNASIRSLRPLILRGLPKNIELDLKLEEAPLDVHIDLGRFETALLNLVANARDAMPRGGRVAITTTTSMDPESCSLPNGRVCVSVDDDGDGMAPDVRAHALDRFFTTKVAGRGTGLGLPAVQAFIAESGGHLSIHSELGRGTSVRLCLTRAAPLPETVRPPGASQPMRGAETILVVEDDDSVRRTLRAVLERQGYRVTEAASGEAALRIIESNDFDLLVTNVVLPRISGAGLVDGVRAMGRRAKVLFLSGDLNATQEALGARSTEAPLLHKPVDPAELLRKVRVILDDGMKHTLENHSPRSDGSVDRSSCH